jgi:uncharacterized protein
MALQHVTDSATDPSPVIHPETERFWSGLADGQLLLQVCSDCGTYRYPLAPVCFNCRSLGFTWTEVGAAGTVAAAVRVQRATGHKSWATEVPYISGLVDLEHDLRLPGRIICACGTALQRGTPVAAVVLDSPSRGSILGFAHACTGDADPTKLRA